LKISKQTAEHYNWGMNCDGWYLVNNPESSIIHERMPPNTLEVRHYHNHAHQFFFVISGTATMEMNGERFVLNPQEGIEVKPLTPHQMFNMSEHDVEFIVFSYPTSKGDRVAVD
jgi:mannose-6-phosphate isomerase-like protein (cupin superfamily)